MQLIINDHVKIYAIQKEFNTMFPYLNLEFFSKFHKSGESTAKKFIEAHTKTLGECRTVRKDGEIIITPEMTVEGLERTFADIYGLAVQVFRKSGRVWLETSVTDDWTLEKQNAEGESLSKIR